jgi:hypothetical protein
MTELNSNSEVKHIGQKESKGKLRVDLVTPQCIIGMAEVLTKALEKYDENSWQNVKDPIDTHYAALFRHLLDWRMGKLDDSESGLSAMKHVLTNAMFLLNHEERFLRNKE